MKSIKDLISTVDLAFLLTASSIYGYGLFYCYSWGKFSFLKLPVTFIELDIKSLTITALAIVIFSSLIFISVTTGDKIFQIQLESGLIDKLRRKKRMSLFILSAIFLGFLLLQIYLVGMSVERLFTNFILPSLVIIFLNRMFRLKKLFYPIVFILIFLLIGAFCLGRASAKEQQNYYILDADKNQSYVILQPYKEQFIVAPINLKKKTVTSKYQLIDMKSEKDNKLEWEYLQVGKLRVKSNQD